MKDYSYAARELLMRLPAQGNTILPPNQFRLHSAEEVEALRSALSFYVTACEQKPKRSSRRAK